MMELDVMDLDYTKTPRGIVQQFLDWHEENDAPIPEAIALQIASIRALADISSLLREILKTLARVERLRYG